MYVCLLKFVQDRKREDTVGVSSEEIGDWSWDGNVPTTHKTKDGKALGRWINNQRSAKSKATLKDEREQRLVNAGLKWSVLASNSWNEMLDELRIYIRDYVSIHSIPRLFFFFIIISKSSNTNSHVVLCRPRTGRNGTGTVRQHCCAFSCFLFNRCQSHT